jgi:hypothetical protein
MGSEMTNTLSGAIPEEAASHPEEISRRRVWFEFGASAGSWIFLGIFESVIAWRACVHQEQFGGPSPHPGARILYFLLWVVSFGLALLAGTLSYRTWRRICGKTRLLRAEGRERQEFMSLSGLFICITLGMGFFWMCLPLFMLQMCARTR